MKFLVAFGCVWLLSACESNGLNGPKGESWRDRRARLMQNPAMMAAAIGYIGALNAQHQAYNAAVWQRATPVMPIQGNPAMQTDSIHLRNYGAGLRGYDNNGVLYRARTDYMGGLKIERN